MQAVEALASRPLGLALDAIATPQLGTPQVAMAQVGMGQASLVGSAMLHDDDQAAAPDRAVLDAINRRLSVVL